MSKKNQQRSKKEPKYKSFRLSQRIKPPVQKKLSSVYSLFKSSNRQIWRYKRVFFGIVLVYIVLTVIFVKGFSSTVNVTDLRAELSETLGLDGIGANAVIVGVAAGSGTTASTSEGNLYQTAIVVLISLAFIWAFRQTGSNPKNTPGIREVFYSSTGPLVAYMIVLFVIGLQLLPMIGGLTLLSIIQTTGIAVNALENTLWIMLALLLSLLSVYMVSSSVFATFIVTLPRMKPLAALRSARRLVKYRRWVILRKMIWLTILILLLFFTLLALTIWLVPVATEWVVVVLSGYIFALGIGAVYALYKELL